MRLKNRNRFAARTSAPERGVHAASPCEWNHVNVFKKRFRRIPKGFHPSAQGCEERATLGGHPNGINPERVASLRAKWCGNPVGVENILVTVTQGSSCLATLGLMTQSRWDWEAVTLSAVCILKRRERRAPIVIIQNKMITRIRRGDRPFVRVLDCGGKRSATPLSHAWETLIFINRLVRSKASPPLPLCRRAP